MAGETPNKPQQNNQTPPTPPTPPSTETKDVVEVPREDFKALLDRLDKLEKSDDQKSAELLTLRRVADQGRLENFERRNKKGDLIRTVRLFMWGAGKDAKIVTNVRMVENISEVDQQGKPFVNQKIELTFRDGTTSKPMEYIDFARRHYASPEYDIVKKIENEEGPDSYQVRLGDGELLDISTDMVNP